MFVCKQQSVAEMGHVTVDLQSNPNNADVEIEPVHHSQNADQTGVVQPSSNDERISDELVDAQNFKSSMFSQSRHLDQVDYCEPNLDQSVSFRDPKDVLLNADQMTDPLHQYSDEGGDHDQFRNSDSTAVSAVPLDLANSLTSQSSFVSAVQVGIVLSLAFLGFAAVVYVVRLARHSKS